MSKPKDLLNNNRKWADKIREDNPDFFENLSKGQNPDYLWIGCSDSRVPPTQIVDLKPGDMFVHRNIANVVLQSDLSCQSVIQYAVEVLKVKHIIVCGHYGCGGVTAAYENQKLGLIDRWLGHIRDDFNPHLEKLEEIDSEEGKIDRLCEINVHAQVENVAHSSFVQQAWKKDQQLSVHGIIYSLKNGQLKDLDICVSSADEASSL